ncbi:DNA polymerase I [Paucilactobacillus suebicus]|uniref:DNA polymerase I n=1 Tax=Paucilactobacillus suebicus DSM 5007 = KCTC 3549 TaxID=1423807 RepID=A0A0R1W607_9LACO|nr:DNA polymerase I [Paucilactobacillus suebicus]KRM13246.1 DNA polymerase I [Paucilactobacillus suebicus DSM 5007 = KCTC 3549]
MTKQLLLIDGNSVAFRAFFALHSQLGKFTNKNGLHTTAIYGFNLMLDHILKEVHPDAALVAFDAGKTTFRTKMFDDYKGGRDKTPEELSEQMPYLKELIKAYGMHSYELPNYEADDIIGTLAKQGGEQGYLTTVVTGDRDLTQLASATTTVSVTHKGVTEVEHYTPEHVSEKLGITPSQIIDMKGLMGDTSDNYPGVSKVGEKTAIKLIKQFDSIENLYENLDELKPSKMKEHLIEDHDKAVLSKQLATINQEAPIEVNVDEIQYSGPQTDELIKFYQEMGFNSFLSKMGGAQTELDLSDPEIKKIKCDVLNKDNLEKVNTLKDNISFYLEMPDENYHTSTFAGFAIGDGSNWLVSRDVDLLNESPLKELLQSQTVGKNVFNAKAMQVGLNRLGIKLDKIDFDLLLVSYLLDTNDNSNDLGELAHQHDYFDVATDETVYGKGAKRAIPDDDDLFFDHIANKARAIYSLKEPLFKRLEENEQTDLYTDIELPLSSVLAHMEIEGVKVNIDSLKNMGSQLTERLSELEQTIYQEAGEEFNINSPKQLGKILFEEMKLPVIKKTKTGYSTAVDVLEKLRADAPIVDNILTYRQISKLQSTYIEGLLKVVHSDDQKIHTRYLQTLTQTGRLSSVDPNLQNIPIRLEEGRKIRHAFIPSHDNWEIFSSDYSQIELRVLAHVTGDHNLQEAFIEGQDIHASTARRIFKLEPDAEVDRNMRRQAKAVNFGIVYGISDYGLSQNIGISRKQAKQFIQTYFEEFPGVKKYIDDIVESAHKRGYVETLTHRRRYLPDINSKNFNQRSFAERTAMNTPIQGSAADIIKIAMIQMESALKKQGLKAKMLLQIHDELVFEAPEEEIPVLEKLVPKVMDSAVSLDVPLKVESAHGKTWYEAK